jgi:hypothetical protein
MGGRIDFRYDAENEIVIATPHWKIMTRDDVLEWYGQYEAYMMRFDRKVDFVVVLDDFEIGAGIGAFWGEYRAKVHKNYIGHNFRVHSSNRVKLYVNTSGARYNVSTEEAATVWDAIEGIKAVRRMAKTA